MSRTRRFHTNTHLSRNSLLILIPLGTVMAASMLPSMPQDTAYHLFADRRILLGIPAFLNVSTNFAFLAVGLAGIVLCARYTNLHARWAWLACFIGVTLVGFGSSYYHLAPDNDRLMWDRLPMSLAFMALTVAVLAEYLNPRLEKYLLAPAIVVGLTSVLYWHYADDLRPYALVQFLPIIMIPAILLLSQRPGPGRGLLLAALAVYLISKLAEHYDHAIFALTGQIISGHSLKHLLAAMALLIVYGMLRRRGFQGFQ